MPVGEMLARTPSWELTEWRAYEQEFGPLGPARGDWQFASLAHVIAMTTAGKKSRRLKISDFLLRWGGNRRGQSQDQQLSILKAFAARQNAQVKQ